MQLELIGPHPFARDNEGRQLSRIGTLFPSYGTLYTQGPGVHAWQRVKFIEHLNAQRTAKQSPPLTPDEEEAVTADSVDLVFESDHVLIRPDPQRMELACAADELLQTLIPKRQVKFLSVSDGRVREAIKRRGECWRLSSIPKGREAKQRMVLGSKVSIHGLPIYFYNRLTGTRWLTCQEFSNLATLDHDALARHLQEIADHCHRRNRLDRLEVDFFGADRARFGAAQFVGVVYNQLAAEQLRAKFEEIKEAFRSAVPEALQRDDFSNASGCERMISALFLEGNESQTEQILSGLSPEFFLQIDWLAGGRVEEGEFLLDSVFEEAAKHPEDPELQRLCDSRAKDIVFNFIRDYGDLEYINLGCLRESLSLDRPQKEGRRGVFLAEFRARSEPAPIKRFLRLQKWGVWEHLDEGKSLLQAIQESDEYTDYWLDRRLGCRQLGMNLCRRVFMRRLTERYQGRNSLFRSQVIRTTYFEREYVPGMATDKLPLDRYARPGYAVALAPLLGRAAASSIIVGRSFDGTRAAFDDGDEVLRETEEGLPCEILLGDHSGAFTEYKLPLETFAADYAQPVNRREKLLPHPRDFARAYLAAFRDQFCHIQGDYRKRRPAFDNLFKDSKYDPGGSFAFRWECVLRRLDQTDAERLCNAISRQIKALQSVAAEAIPESALVVQP
ncbi:MAG TPA: hypothetical protein VL361_22265 [Candidatus Limnocylindrales bacterium]|nr:hypothetical protein [Candidatus Limnocylindrales bacterium]